MSRSAIHFADLMQVVGQLERSEWPAAALALGYAWQDPQSDPEPQPEAASPPPELPRRKPKPRQPLQPSATDAEAAPLFWRVLADEPNPDAVNTAPDWVSSAARAPDSAFESDPLASPPALAPLIAPGRVATFLRRHLARQQPGDQLDLGWAIRRIAAGRAILRLRRQPRWRWPARLDLVVDVGPQLAPLRHDLLAIADQVSHLLGDRVRRWQCDGDAERLTTEDRSAPARLGSDGTPCLVISDAGGFGDAEDRQRWQALGWRQQQGCGGVGRALLIAPLRRADLDAGLAGAFDVALLGDGSLRRAGAVTPVGATRPSQEPVASEATPLRSRGLRALLAAMAGLSNVPAWLLRSLRRELQQAGLPVDIATEVELLADVNAVATNGHASAVRRTYLPQALADLNSDLLPAGLRDHIVRRIWSDWLPALSPLVRAQYAMQVATPPAGAARYPAALARDLREGFGDAEVLWRKLAARFTESDAAAGDSGLAAWVQRLHDRDRALLTQSKALQAAWVIAAAHPADQPLPEGFDAAALQWLIRDQGAVEKFALCLVAAPAAAGGQPPGVALIRVDGASVSATAALSRRAFATGDCRNASVQVVPPAVGNGSFWAARAFGEAVAIVRSQAPATIKAWVPHWRKALSGGMVKLSREVLSPVLEMLSSLVSSSTPPDSAAIERAAVECLAAYRRAHQIERWTDADSPLIGAHSGAAIDLAAGSSKATDSGAANWSGLMQQLLQDAGIAAVLPLRKPSPPRAIHPGERLPLNPQQTHRITLADRRLLLDAVPRPAWAKTITREGADMFATTRDGRLLRWVPATPWRVDSATAATWRLPQACWWDAAEFGALVGAGGVLTCPSWAARHGVDEFGWWAEFEVAEAVASAATATAVSTATATTPLVVQRMRFIPPGRFWKGSPLSEAERYDDETLHPVTLPHAFWLAETACTQALWTAVMGDNPSGFSGDSDCPVEQVSWDDVVQRFIPALNSRYQGLKLELPSEAQWEYACRAGSNTPFSFGNGIGVEQVNYDGNYPYEGGKKGEYRERTVPVKNFPANDWGLHQMHGNVDEWCADEFADYPAVEIPDPVIKADSRPGGPAARVLRGGSWVYGARYCRGADRNAYQPGIRFDDIGFRLARGLPAAGPAEPGIGEQAEPADFAEPSGTKRRRGIAAKVARRKAGDANF